MNKEQTLALACARLAIGAETATVMVRQLVSLIDDLEKLDEERRRSLNEITTQRDELREQHAQCALHEVSCPECGVTIRARMADAPRSGRFQIEHPDTETLRESYAARTRPAPNYMEQVRLAGIQLQEWLEQARRAGFYTVAPDELHVDIDATARDTSNDPKWTWHQDPKDWYGDSLSMSRLVRAELTELPLQDDVPQAPPAPPLPEPSPEHAERLRRDAIIHNTPDHLLPDDEQPEFPDAEDEPPDRPVYETDPLKE